MPLTNLLTTIWSIVTVAIMMTLLYQQIKHQKRNFKGKKIKNKE